MIAETGKEILVRMMNERNDVPTKRCLLL